MFNFLFDIDNHYQYDSYVGYIHIKGDVMLIMIKKKYINAFVIAATLAVPLSGFNAPIAKADVIEMKAASKLADGTYDVILKTYKDQTNETSVASTYFKKCKSNNSR